MTILELIQAQCRVLSVPEKHAEKIQKLFKIEKEEGIGTFVQMFKDNILSDIQTNEQANQTAAQEAISEYEKKHNLKDGKLVEKQEPTKVDTSGLSPELKALFEAQQKTLDTLTGVVTGMSKAQQTTQSREAAKALFKGKIDDEFLDEYLDRIDFNAEDFDMNAAVEAQVKNFTTLKQKFITKAVSDGSYTPVSGGASDTEINQYLKGESDKQTEDSFGGIKI